MIYTFLNTEEFPNCEVFSYYLFHLPKLCGTLKFCIYHMEVIYGCDRVMIVVSTIVATILMRK